MTAKAEQWSLRARLGAAFGLGAVMASGQAPLGFWGLTLIGLAALTLLVAREPGRKTAALTGWFGGAGYFALSLSWIFEPFLIDAARDGWMAPFAVVLISFGLALFWALAGFLSALPTHPARRALAFATALAAVELARGYVLTGFPWALVGHVWIGSWPAQAASLIGPSGLTLMTTLAVALPVAFRWKGALAGGLILAAAAGFGWQRLQQPEPEAPGITLRLVQPNVDQATKWLPGMARMLFDRQLAFTAAEPRPDAVIWPETAVPYLLEESEGALIEMAEAAQGVPVLAGIQRGEGWRFWNSLVVVAADAGVQAVYDKHHLVPFGEYIPFGDTMDRLFGIRAFAAQQGNGYSEGAGASVLDLGALGKVLPLICYEAVFPQDLRAAPERADWILQVTNDAWFGTLTGPYQHLAQARLRAIEQGLPLVRVANTGVSALIDAKGRILDELPLGAAGYKDVALPGSLPATPFATLGEFPVLLMLAALAAGLLLRRRPRQA
ncbi:apolipoprotein N-acyltransferase [Cereibacter changlensis]|uniref:Apolipoprotein N-acyltransferase n=1 Tax=Cereibacter changlensis TaxID=402884 RepID=A0A4U0Z1Y2_9RHOB|nr:apolipoprotein N-acyltransferase [Cereibacter changlensis]TKA96381.1 apolipoprotein N-acyltransferase [Cereibacter changlensis]